MKPNNYDTETWNEPVSLDTRIFKRWIRGVLGVEMSSWPTSFKRNATQGFRVAQGKTR
jgi:hypothetical protein